MFRTLCFEYKLLQIDYFLDELQMYEAEDIVKNLPYIDRTEREIQRYQLYVAIQANSKRKIDIKDVMKFAWDKVETEEVEYTEAEEKRLTDNANAFLDMLNKGEIKVESASFGSIVQESKSTTNT